jgi:uncharacterized Zn-finger protein
MSAESGAADFQPINNQRSAQLMVLMTKPLLQPNAQNHYDVTSEDLPLSCPMPQMYLWNSHPRVYLPIRDTGWAKCPYCGAEYTLKD